MNGKNPDIEEDRFREIFRAIHADHPACLDDEWLTRPCRRAGDMPVERPVAWSRRNGRWGEVEILWVGAAPGNAGGRGSGEMGAHGTRIPFGGDVAGGNLDVLLGSIGVSRNDTFITAALNRLPERGGGEPTLAELAAPEGEFSSSLHVLRATVLAAGPRLIILLGNVGLRATMAAALTAISKTPLRLPSLSKLQAAGLGRGRAAPWPQALLPDRDFISTWRDFWNDQPLPQLLWLTHPSAQNISPYAGVGTRFHTRMIEARQALIDAVQGVLGRDVPPLRPDPPANGVYALPEWVERIGPRHAELARLWQAKGV